jgi:cytoskeletal protein RodZ
MSEINMPDTVPVSPETPGGSPGAVLRRCREFHGFTLEDASETTKIGISYLKALESDQISAFANQAYLKGFLRIYVNYLGLNYDDVARMYGKLFGVQDDKPAPASVTSAPTRRSRRMISLKKMLFPALLLAMILITATFFNRPPPPLVRPPAPAAVVLSPSPVTAVQTVQSSVRVKKEEADIPTKEDVRPPEPPVYEEPVVSVRPAEAAKGFILKIKVTQSGALTATVDDSGQQQYELEVGDVLEWKAEKKVTLELSNAGGVDVELNGKPYRALGPPGEPAYIELDATGVKK